MVLCSELELQDYLITELFPSERSQAKIIQFILFLRDHEQFLKYKN